MELRPYQIGALNAIKKGLDRGLRAMVLCLFTSAGKTVIFSRLKPHLGLKGRVLILVHTEELMQQTVETLKEWSPELTVSVEMADSAADSHSDIVVAGIDTMYRDNRLAKFGPDAFELIICDEAHLSVAPKWVKVLDFFKAHGENAKTLLVGFTATIKRADGVGLVSCYEELVFNYGILDGIRDGWCAAPVGKLLRSSVNLDGVPSRGGDLAIKELSLAVNTPAANREVVEFWEREGESRKTLGFCVDVDHAKCLAAAFCERGHKAEAIWGSDPSRKEKLARLKSGETQVLLNCNVLIAGFDQRDIGCILMVRATKSAVLFTQALGRGARILKGITNLLESKAAGVDTKYDFLVLDVGHSSKVHSLQSLPSIFGLPPKMDLHGKNILEAVETFQKVALTVPGADLSEATDIDNLQTYAEEIDLLSVSYPAEITENSDFQWHPRPDGGYILTLPNRQNVTIDPKGLNKWSVSGVVENTTFGPNGYDRLDEAFAAADGNVRRYGRRLIQLLKRNPTAKWAKDAPTDNQIKALTMRIKQLGMALPDWSKVTKADAIQLHRKLYGPQYTSSNRRKIA